MIRRPPRSTLSSSSAASDVYKRQVMNPTSFDNIVSATVYYFLGITGGVPNTLIGTISFVLWLSLIHISEPTRLLSISYAVFCLKKKKKRLMYKLKGLINIQKS
eukprot:TRINITY_DN61675_c0_g1_i1.p1 TRINITY_DN61675_c0_g1~~TRINITY_DN61675_c0_g1_i1.p1  ORF type:complete len:104 (+),score=20.08 TRINITY_DN61675_c0_g1_i1:69-380(+)